MVTFCVRRQLLLRKERTVWLELLQCRGCTNAGAALDETDHMGTLMKLCCDRHYIAHDHDSPKCIRRGSSWTYGPLGMELRKNILDQWWSSVVTTRPQVFGINTLHGFRGGSGAPERTLKLIDTEALHQALHQAEMTGKSKGDALQKLLQGSVSMRTNLLQGALEQYVASLELVNRKLAFGLAETGLCYQLPEDQPGELDCSPSEVLQASLVWFCSPRTSSQWLDYWARQRLQWWRKFALSPSSFSCSDVTVGEEGENMKRGVKVLYQFPWGSEALETLCNLGNTELLQIHIGSQAKLQCRDGKRSVVPHVISVSGNIDRGLLAYLHNSLQEVKKVDSRQRQHMRKVLKLHPSLTPVKVAVNMGKGATSDLRQVCEGLLQELLDGGISSWPGYLENMSPSLEQLKYDEMGVLFTVVISDSTLESGLVQLRSRDTTIKETMHISEVKNFLAKYIAAAENV
ncbi:DNA polymerase subunit gamma-2, mitochondrial isoform X1 [Brienomyrus brachyistius]|uniref:DNA polymerase subunit gamma-2, mitochondrial isoform X1 n=1 Tax=Brienomyrus brachyistius TaxID=42636 RepID=UPI0020B1CECB|nr:DNA polymerase subunit gamma-2, mitochondrial isoform X1 [Brienomyrus brachyistius]